MSTKIGKDLARALSASKIYKDYERAFSEATHMPLSFHPAESWQLAQHGQKYENPFCALMAKSQPACSMCLETQHKLTNSAGQHTATAVCIAGLYESAVPVKLGNELVGYLKTGQIACEKPARQQFKNLVREILKWGVHTDLKKLEDAYFHTTVLSKEQYHSMLRLLEVFAQHLSLAAEQIVVQRDNAESPMITRAKAFIDERQTEPIALADVAKAVNASTYHFCKMFKKATGLTFTEYLSLVRVGKAKNLLLNPNLHVSEAAYQVGFNSLTHFNRVFRKLVGRSPTAYRESLRK